MFFVLVAFSVYQEQTKAIRTSVCKQYPEHTNKSIRKQMFVGGGWGLVIISRTSVRATCASNTNIHN